MESTLMKFALLTLLLTISMAVGSSPPPPITDDIIKKVAASLTMYVDPLPQMPKLYGYAIKDGCPVPVHLTIGMFRKKWRFHRDLPPTTVFVYGTSAAAATFPGPTIETLQGTPFSVTWKNHLPFRHILPRDPTIPVASTDGGVPTVVHLHGGIHEPQSDGNPLSWFTSNYRSTGPAFSSHTYSYANIQQPGNLWYHDHALGLTRANILAGLLGAVVIRNPELERPFNLPKCPNFDLHLVLTDRSFTPDGSLFMNSTGINPSIHPEWQPAYSGEAIVVNGKVWPFLTVHRRKYRFRILNASNARFFNLSLSNKLAFTIIGSDASYLSKPVISSSILLAPAEIFDVVIDFHKSKKSHAELINKAPFPYPQGGEPDSLNRKVMKFKIEKLTKGCRRDKSRIPKRLVDYPAEDKVAEDKLIKKRYITMYEYDDDYGYPTHFYINGKRFKDPVTEMPKVGTVEVWEVINLTGDTHPLHIHLGFSQAVRARELVNLTAFTECMKKKKNAVKCEVVRHAVGKVVKTVKYERTWKNVVKIAPGFMTTVVVKFQLLDRNVTYPFDSTAEPGYIYHCHILDHEDNAMLRPLKLIS